MTFSKITTFSAAMAAALMFSICMATPARAQAPTVFGTTTSDDGLLTLVLSSANPSDAVGVNNTYTWTAINNSPTIALSGVTLGSHWGDHCPLCVSPSGPTLISMAPGCGSQSPDEFPQEIAHFGVWCTPITGVTLPPGQSVSGSVTLRPGTGGPADYLVYSLYNLPTTGKQIDPGHAPFLPNSSNPNRSVVAPAATDIQITGSASNGAPPAGSNFTYTYQVKNAGPWGTYGGIIFVDTLPSSLTYVGSFVTAISPSTGQPVEAQLCTAVGQTVTCPLFDLQNGGTTGQVTITLTVTASSVSQQIVNTASAATVLPQTDSNPANNSVTVTVTTK
jgi:uncharacterized repeat protein (TIGR01451 family)